MPRRTTHRRTTHRGEKRRTTHRGEKRRTMPSSGSTRRRRDKKNKRVPTAADYRRNWF